MKITAFILGLSATAYANIYFPYPHLHCNLTSPKIYHGCLRGQDCLDNGDCMPQETIRYPLSFRSLEVRDTPAYSIDGTCGPTHGNTICDPNSTAYTGGCCSQYGYCGNTIAHCGAGCISGCPATPPIQTGTDPRPDGLCGATNGGATCDPKGPFGGCCSSHGFCGSTSDHCDVSNGCQSGCSGAATDPRGDGNCGAGFSGATCDPKGLFGGCCSKYGYCGITPDHCLVSNGCQSGCTDGTPTSSGAPPVATTGEPVIAPVGGGGAGAVTTDGTCGASNGNTVCGNWPNGNCCSMYGFCGNTDAHCGAGCQSGNCLGPPAVPVPGPSPAPAAPNPGSFNVIGQSGVPAMHAALMPNGRVMFLDKLENYTQLKTSDGYYAMSAEYDPTTNTPIPLAYLTNAFCSGGTFLADGRVISVGGNAPLTWLDPNIGDGFTAIRYLHRSSSDASLDGQSWSEPGNKLASARWYATAQTMPDGTVFVASGSLNGLDPSKPENNNPTYETLSPAGISQGQNIPMDILSKNQPYYMYPFVHLLKDGTLFVFVSKSAQIFNVQSNTIVKELPGLAGDYRTYPNTGGSVLLPLSSKTNWEPEVVICGGGAYQDITSPTDPSCGRIAPLSANPQWEMDSMPQGRGMVEATLLPDGTVLWMNGGNRGAQGFGLMSDPTTTALLYDPAKPLGQRWTTLASTSIARLYHSVALLLLDGTVMVAGSNPVQMPILQPDAQDPYVTEFRVEQFMPPYMQGIKPGQVQLSSTNIQADGSTFSLSFVNENSGAQNLKIVLYHGGFVTHSVHMGHRMLELDFTNWAPGAVQQNLVVTGPPNNNVAPPGPYVVYVVVDGVPSTGQFVQVI